MQKRSHKLLASSLLTAHCGFERRRYEWAFLFGSFQPDCNPFTFLRGSLRGRPLGGHSFSNSQRYIHTRIRMLQRRSIWRIHHYYTLGKLTHYLADAFTYPHNESFSAPLMDHHRYETALRHSLIDYLSSQRLSPQPCCHNLLDTIDHLHRQYRSARSGIPSDIRYILEATGLLMSTCRPDPLQR